MPKQTQEKKCCQLVVVMDCWQWDGSDREKPWELVPKWVEDLIPHWGRTWLFVPMKNAAGSGIKLYPGDWMIKGPDGEVFVVPGKVFPMLFKEVTDA